VLLSAAFVGFLGGTRRGRVTPRGYHPPVEVEARPGAPAATYRDLREKSSHPNAAIYRASRLMLEGLLPSRSDPVPPRTEQTRALALEARRARRAFDGAPPTIPHAVDERAEPNCMVCHERGVKIGDRVAPQLSHRYYQSCTQCHVPGPGVAGSRDEFLPFDRSVAATTPFAESDFEPLAFGGLGSRAWPKAPPVMPHPEAMRERCESCHGVSGRAGLRTPHPDRQSCQQCHVAGSAGQALFSQAAL